MIESNNPLSLLLAPIKVIYTIGLFILPFVLTVCLFIYEVGYLQPGPLLFLQCLANNAITFMCLLSLITCLQKKPKPISEHTRNSSIHLNTPSFFDEIGIQKNIRAFTGTIKNQANNRTINSWHLEANTNTTTRMHTLKKQSLL